MHMVEPDTTRSNALGIDELDDCPQSCVSCKEGLKLARPNLLPSSDAVSSDELRAWRSLPIDGVIATLLRAERGSVARHTDS